MRKMMKAIAAVLAVSALMAGSAFAAEKFAVKDSLGTTSVFSVSETGTVIEGAVAGTPAATAKFQLHYPTAATANDYIWQMFHNGKSRVNIQAGGFQEWIFSNDNTTNIGKFMYAVPGSSPGLIIFTGPNTDQSRFNIANWAGTHFRFYYQNHLGFYVVPNGAGVLTTQPKAALDVKASSSGTVVMTGITAADKTNVNIGGTYTGTEPATYVITVNGTGTPNTFTWSKNGGAASSSVAMTGAAQTISDGITATFSGTTGYTLSSTWTVYAGQAVNVRNTSDASIFVVNNNGKVGIGTASPTSALQVVGLPTYESNATASANLSAGAFYKTSTGVLMVVY